MPDTSCTGLNFRCNYTQNITVFTTPTSHTRFSIKSRMWKYGSDSDVGNNRARPRHNRIPPIVLFLGLPAISVPKPDKASIWSKRFRTKFVNKKPILSPLK